MEGCRGEGVGERRRQFSTHKKDNSGGGGGGGGGGGRGATVVLVVSLSQCLHRHKNRKQGKTTIYPLSLTCLFY